MNFFYGMKKQYDNLTKKYPGYGNGLKIVNTLKEKNISEANKLNRKIQEQYFYYKNNKPLVEDEEYDSNKKKLAKILKEYPEIKKTLINYESLDEIDSHKKLINLNKLIEIYKKAYENNKSMISDRKYDETLKLAADIENKYPKLKGTIEHFLSEDEEDE